VELTQLYRRKKTKKLVVKVLRDAERESAAARYHFAGGPRG